MYNQKTKLIKVDSIYQFRVLISISKYDIKLPTVSNDDSKQWRIFKTRREKKTGRKETGRCRHVGRRRRRRSRQTKTKIPAQRTKGGY